MHLRFDRWSVIALCNTKLSDNKIEIVHRCYCLRKVQCHCPDDGDQRVFADLAQVHITQPPCAGSACRPPEQRSGQPDAH